MACECEELENGLCGETRPPDIIYPFVCCNIDGGALENVPDMGPPPCWCECLRGWTCT
jgi:hypothetical protein